MSDRSLLRFLSRKLRSIQLIGVASGCGASDPRCEAAPDTLRAAHLASRLRLRGFTARWAPVIRPIRPAPRDRCDPRKVVHNVCVRLSQRVEQAVNQGDLPVVVGGDHSCAIGTWKGIAHAVQPRGGIGLLWIDAHMDAHTPQTTETGMLHGMPVACLLGHGHPELADIAEGIRVAPEAVCLFGVRSFERDEARLLDRLGVRVFYMKEIAERGVQETLREALGIVRSAPAGFGVTLDLDAIDPHDAPGVGTPAPGGMRASELMHALAEHGGAADLLGIEIVEYNPFLDPAAATGALVGEALDALLAGQPSLSFALKLPAREARVKSRAPAPRRGIRAAA